MSKPSIQSAKHSKRSSLGFLTKRREPFRFMLLLAIAGSVMLFFVLLMAYLVRKGQGVLWQEVALPRIFWLSTLLISMSSLTLHWANKAFRNESFLKYRILLATTLGLGIAFMAMQLLGWQDMRAHGILLRNNPAGGFIYLVSGLHLVHIMIGVVLLAIGLVEALKRTTYIDAFVYSVNPPNQLKLRLITLYWHFIDALWVLLFLFLLYHHSK